MEGEGIWLAYPSKQSIGVRISRERSLGQMRRLRGRASVVIEGSLVSETLLTL